MASGASPISGSLYPDLSAFITEAGPLRERLQLASSITPEAVSSGLSTEIIQEINQLSDALEDLQPNQRPANTISLVVGKIIFPLATEYLNASLEEKLLYCEQVFQEIHSKTSLPTAAKVKLESFLCSTLYLLLTSEETSKLTELYLGTGKKFIPSTLTTVAEKLFTLALKANEFVENIFSPEDIVLTLTDGIVERFLIKNIQDKIPSDETFNSKSISEKEIVYRQLIQEELLNAGLLENSSVYNILHSDLKAVIHGFLNYLSSIEASSSKKTPFNQSPPPSEREDSFSSDSLFPVQRALGLTPPLENDKQLDSSAEFEPIAPSESTPIVITYMPQHLTYTHSYIELAFPDLVTENLSDKELYDRLPPSILTDACRHIFSLNLNGAVENRIKAIFHSFEPRQKLEKLKTDSSLEGEILLRDYYSGLLVTSKGREEIEKKFTRLEKDPRFYGFVYELAVAADVQIAEWDLNWAENNYLNPSYIHLSFQALERCLHT